MPSVKNPNKQSQNRMASRSATKRKLQQRRSANGQTDRITKADSTRGGRPGLLPTSGPRAPLSKKKQKKVIQRMTLALKRKAEIHGIAAIPELVAADDAMTDAPVTANAAKSS